jgi:heptosyltransferase-1
MFRAGTSDRGTTGERILIVRLGAMGDIIHALPAVASLKHGFPGSDVSWVVHRRWTPLLEGNPFVDRVIPLDRCSLSCVREAWKDLRARPYDFAVDFQGLVQSAVIASVARPDRIFGFHQSQVKEKPAALFYSTRIRAVSRHVVDRNLELAAAAGASAMLQMFPLPEGEKEGELPEGEFVLANPLAGWGAKQWPLENYGKLGRMLREELGIPLVLNGAPDAAGTLGRVKEARVHVTGIPGLIYATRRARAVVGIDSGPLHLAAALGKPGVAIYGPTDPARNGPYGETFTVLRSAGAITSFKRRKPVDRSMEEITPEMVFEALKGRIGLRASSAGSGSA